MVIFDIFLLVLLMDRWTEVDVRQVLCEMLAFCGFLRESDHDYDRGRENVSGSLRPMLLDSR
jgi:hypothetical protein